MSDICNCTSIGELLTNYDDTQVRSDIQQLNTDINTQTGRINTALSDLETAKTTKIAEMDAAKVAAETATAAAIVATQATQTAIAQAERLNVELEGSVITVTDKDGNESEIDLLDATNERVYINVTTNKEGQSVAGLVINCFLNNDVDEPLQATTNANGQCYFDVPNNYHYKLVFPTIAGCDPITDVTHIAHASQRIVDVEYKETVIPPFPPIEGEHVTIAAFIKENNVTTPYEGLEVVITIDGTAETYQIDEDGYIMMIIPFGKTYRVEYPRLGDEGYYVLNNKYVYDCISEKFNRIIKTTYNLCDSGVYIVDDTGSSYLPDDFFELVRNNQKTNDQALMIKVATSELIGNGGVFALDIDILRNRTFGTSNRTYCTQNILLETIPLNGNDITDDLYFKGYETSVLAYEEISRKLGSAASPLFSYIMPMTKIINGITLNGFVGSIGQWRVCQEVMDIIDGILVAVRPNGKYLLGQLSTYSKNTSTQSSQTDRWCWTTQPYPRDKLNVYPPNLGIPFFTIF